MMAHELRSTIVDMNKKDGTGRSGFEQQFEVGCLYCTETIRSLN